MGHDAGLTDVYWRDRAAQEYLRGVDDGQKQRRRQDRKDGYNHGYHDGSTHGYDRGYADAEAAFTPHLDAANAEINSCNSAGRCLAAKLDATKALLHKMLEAHPEHIPAYHAMLEETNSKVLEIRRQHGRA